MAHWLCIKEKQMRKYTIFRAELDDRGLHLHKVGVVSASSAVEALRIAKQKGFQAPIIGE
jgi:hypothetical protein